MDLTNLNKQRRLEFILTTQARKDSLFPLSLFLSFNFCKSCTTMEEITINRDKRDLEGRESTKERVREEGGGG
jgi:hypothetical protein